MGDSAHPIVGQAIANDALASMVRRTVALLEDVGPDVFPVYRDTDSEIWAVTHEWNWASGHWIGLLLLAARSSEPALRLELEKVATALAQRIAETESTDNIFFGLNAYLAGFVGYDQTGDERLLEFGLAGADAMVDLFHEQAQQIPIGRHETIGIDPRIRERDQTSFDRRYVAAVDVIHTSAPVLWRAWRETGNAKYRDVAFRHSVRHLDWHLRDDGSVSQKTAFSEDDGRPMRQFSPLAGSDSGCWSRGLAWHVAGTFEAWRVTSDQQFLKSVEQSLHFYSGHTTKDLIPRYDLNAHTGPLDTSAAAIIAWGLRRAGGAEETGLVEIRDAILRSLLDGHLDGSGRLTHGCYSVSSGTATDAELIWGNFYLASALETSQPRPAPSE